MIWLGLLVVVGLVFFLRSRYNEDEVMVPQAVVSTAAVSVPAAGAAEEDGELLAIIAAVIAEFEGTSDFQVMSITAKDHSNWAAAARQQPMYNRL